MVEYEKSEDWKEVKEQDVLIKLIASKKPLSIPQNAADDDDDVPETQPLVRLDDTVLINLTARQSNDASHLDGPICQQASQWICGVGDLDVLPKAVEWGLTKMRAGDICLIWCSQPAHAYGEESRRTWKNEETGKVYTLPSDSPVMFQVEVMQIVADTSRLNPYFSLQKAMTRKKIANDIYQNEWNSGGKARERAIRLYEKAGKDMHKLLHGTYFQQVGDPEHPQRKECKAILGDCFNNIVAVYLSAKRYTKAREAALEIMDKYDRNNIKAHLRYAKACILDSTCTTKQIQEAFDRTEGAIGYRNPTEEEELKKLKAQWKRRKQQTQGQ